MSSLEKWDSSLRLGLLGTGQLAQMLVKEAQAWGLYCVVFGPEVHGPARGGASESIVGSFSDQEALKNFLSRVDLIVFENEFVDCNLLSQVARQFPSVRFVPDLATMEHVRDKAKQKALFKSLKIPTADFIEFSTKDPVLPWFEEVLRRFPQGAVLKWGRAGYDGKGVFVLSSDSSFEKAQEFVQAAIQRNVSLYAEALVYFRRELAMIACVGANKELVTYPLVVSEQKEGICWNVMGPAVVLGVSSDLESKAKNIAEKISRSVPLKGVFALEFFETAQGELLVNELAPRVHNSGHYTQNASVTSQFENHLRAALSLPLGETKSAQAFAMLNLLGPEGVHLDGVVPLPIPSQRAHVHWYGKKGVTPRRKVGHINGAVSRLEERDAMIRELEAIRNKWEKDLRGKHD